MTKPEIKNSTLEALSVMALVNCHLFSVPAAIFSYVVMRTILALYEVYGEET